jgi:formylglycine-generating enzyme required for sulfatase activity
VRPIRKGCRHEAYAVCSVACGLWLVAVVGCGNSDPSPDEQAISRDQTQNGDPIVNSIGMRLVSIQAGTFTMGADDNNAYDDDNAHQVTLTQAFHLGQHEVTQERYQKVMGKTPSHFKGLQKTVESVNWDEAVEFFRKLSALPAERSAGSVYRLPTEAEWEYACRAGTKTTYSFGDSDSELGEYAWYNENSGRTTQPVGQKKPNPWGLYDMHGNVWEWCQDWVGDYSSGSTTDPRGATSGSSQVYRGGCWLHFFHYCRSALRGRSAPDFRYDSLGFRVLRRSIK